MRRRLSREFKLNTLSVGSGLLALVLAIGYFQSDTEPRWTRCVVDGHPQKVLIAGVKKWASKRLFCENNRVVIAIKKDQVLPLTKDEVLTPGTTVACTYDVARNPFYLFREQILTDSVECLSNSSDPLSDTG
ncbi:MAG: hypothetical protein KBD06_05580 [Candidatus Pacebacteria bacterium]|nr:hypothetical protein [Candidatus Paceibacterota bacterium]